MADGLRERYEWKGFKIYFGKKDDYMYGSVIAGATVLKSCRHESLEKVKKEVRFFLEDSNNIRDVIKRNHSRKLVEKGIKNSAEIYTSGKKRGQVNRVTHCYSCGHGLSSFEDFSCSTCNWLLCACGACGCGYMYY